MRPYEAHPFSRPIDLIIINRPLLTNFGLLRARFFGLHALYALLFNFNFAQLFFARFLYFLCLLFCLSRSFFASKFFARGRTFNFLPSFLFYCLPGLFVSYNRLLQLFIYRRTLSLTFCLFQRGCTFTHLSNFYSPKRTEPRSRARERAYF
jgi:hypothetical protein